MRRLLLLGCLAALVFPAGASAGTAKLVRQPGDERQSPTEAFEYRAAPGEMNRVTTSEQSGGAILVTDSAGVALGRGCARPVAGDMTRALCRSPENLDITGGSTALGDRNDVGTDTTTLAFSISGGAGNDSLSGGSVYGDDGNDVLHGSTYLKGGRVTTC